MLISHESLLPMTSGEALQVSSDANLDIQSPADSARRLQGLAAIVLCQAFGSDSFPTDVNPTELLCHDHVS